MSLKFSYGALTPDKINGFFGPNLFLSGDPAVDQPAMRTANFAGGRLACLVASSYAGAPAYEAALVPMDGGVAANRPFGVMVNGGGNYAESIGVSGSRKLSVARALVMFDAINDIIDPPCYVASPVAAYTLGAPLYSGSTFQSTLGQWTSDIPKDSGGTPLVAPVVCGIVLHVPSVAYPFLGVATTF